MVATTEIPNYIETSVSSFSTNSFERGSINLILSHSATSFVVGGRKGIPNGSLLSPFVPYSNQILNPTLSENSSESSSPIRCVKCAAYLNKYCNYDSCFKLWTCCFCKFRNASNDDVSYNNTSKIAEYFDFDHEIMKKSTDTSIYSFVIDGNTPKDSLLMLSDHLTRIIPKMNQNSLILLIVYTGVVNVYSLGQSKAIVSNVLPGSFVAPRTQLDNSALSFDNIFGYLEIVGRNVPKIVSSLKGLGSFDQSKGIRPHRTKRCLGPAIEYALYFISQMKYKSAHLILFSSGSSNVGPGAMMPHESKTASIDENIPKLTMAIEHFKRLSDSAAQNQIGIDVFCIGTEYFCISAMHTLTSSTGGYVITHERFSEAFSKDLTVLLCKSPQSRLQSNSTNSTQSCGVNVRIGSGLKLTKVINPLIKESMQSFSNLSRISEVQNVYIPIARPDPNFSLALYYSDPPKQLKSDQHFPYVHLQYVIRFINSNGIHVSRVITDRIQLSNNLENSLKLDDVDPIVSAILLAKYSVMQIHEGHQNMSSIRLKAEKARKSVNKCLFEISKVHKNSSRSKGKYERSSFPENLIDFLKACYHLNRGCLLGKMRLSNDEAFQLRYNFLKSNLEDSILYMIPKLTLVEVAIEENEYVFSYENIEPETTAMLPDRILILEINCSMYIWMGKYAVEADQRENILNQLILRCKIDVEGRFPAPEILVLRDGGYMSRHMICRLIPSHRDYGLNDKDERIRMIKREMPFTEELSFFEFCAELSGRNE